MDHWSSEECKIRSKTTFTNGSFDWPGARNARASFF
jgi:hypothetical protein